MSQKCGVRNCFLRKIILLLVTLYNVIKSVVYVVFYFLIITIVKDFR